VPFVPRCHGGKRIHKKSTSNLLHQERRRKERYELRLAMHVWPKGASGCRYNAMTLNVSATGLLFVLTSGNPEEFRPGMSFQFNIELPDGADVARPSVECIGSVVRVDEDCSRKIASTITTWQFVRQGSEAPEPGMTQCRC